MKKIEVTIRLHDETEVKCQGYQVVIDGDSGFVLHRSLGQVEEDGTAHFIKDKWTVSDSITGRRLYGSRDSERGETRDSAIARAAQRLMSVGGAATIQRARDRGVGENETKYTQEGSTKVYRI